jgi:RND family efflux transporter MFP subunit
LAPVSIQVTPVERISIQRRVDLSGTLASLDQVRVSSEVAGVVRDMNVELGQEVRAGQVIIQLDTQELEFALARAESALRQTEAQLGIDSARADVVPPDDQIASVRTATANRDDARAQLARAQELVTKGLLPKAELDTTETRLKVTEAALQAALENVRALKASLQDRRAAHEFAKKKVEDAAIRAPVSGAIAERLVQRGEFIRENTQVVTIVQLNPLTLQTGVQEKFAGVIRPTMMVEFRVEPYPDEGFTGRIVNISPSINQESRTFPVEILVDNAARKLKPGFFAKGTILTHIDANVLAVPEETVSTLAGVSSVYVVENGMARQQNVTLGAKDGKYFEILSGLQGNEVLAASNLTQIVSGTPVTTGAPGDGEAGEPGLPPEEGTETGGPRGAGQRGQRGGGARSTEGGTE